MACSGVFQDITDIMITTLGSRLELFILCSEKHALFQAFCSRHGFAGPCASRGARRPAAKALGTGSGAGAQVRTGSRLNAALLQGGLRTYPYIYIYIQVARVPRLIQL